MNVVVFLSVVTLFLPSLTFAAEGTEIANPGQPLDLTQHWAGYLALIVFSVAYILAMTEEVTELKKSKPMVFAASLIWIFIAGCLCWRRDERTSRSCVPRDSGRLWRAVFVYHGVDDLSECYGRPEAFLTACGSGC